MPDIAAVLLAGCGLRTLRSRSLPRFIDHQGMASPWT